jgi:hypothetical protein
MRAAQDLNPPEPPSVVEEPARATEGLVVAPWFVDKLEVSGQRVSVAGWSIALNSSEDPSRIGFAVNGRPFDRLRYPLPRPDVGAVFWMHPGAERCGFDGAVDELSEPYPDGVLEVRRTGLGTPAIESGRDSWFKPDPALHTRLPDADRRFRVIGNRDADGFLLSGATDYHRIDRVVTALSGRHLHELGAVLDWGVGCGRIARHFPADRAKALTGCDIDHDNVAWCKANLDGTFVDCGINPPLPFTDASFNLIYGVSIFTHLREPMQLRWLEELRRVSAPGALLLTTIHGRTAIDFTTKSPAEYRRLRDEVAQNGIVVTGDNAQIDGHAEHGGEYVNVLQSIDYVNRVWGRYFKVEHVLQGYILHHDLVVLRKT